MVLPSKPELRATMRARLAQLAPQRQARSQAAALRLAGQPEYRAARVVFTFLSLPQELNTDPLIAAALAAGKLLCAPRADWQTRALTPLRLYGADPPHVSLGPRGIREPATDELIAPADIDLVLVPGLAFDAQGYRLGQGGGFFDRFLARPELRAIRCGLAFEEQLVAAVPREPHDEPMDLCVTDAQLRRWPARRG